VKGVKGVKRVKELEYRKMQEGAGKIQTKILIFPQPRRGFIFIARYEVPGRYTYIHRSPVGAKYY